MIRPRPVPGHPDLLEQPEAVQPSEEKEPALYCFLEEARVCGSDCVAYNTDPPKEQDYVGQPWAHCHLLVNAHRAGKHLVILASLANRLVPRGTSAPAPPVPR